MPRGDTAPVPGSPEAQAWKEKMAQARQEAQRRREDEARAALGGNASTQEIEAFLKEAKTKQRQAKQMARLATVAQKDASAAAMRVATAVSTSSSSNPEPQQQAEPPPKRPQVLPASTIPDDLIAARSELRDHAIFGSAVLPGATVVELWREPSGHPLHNGRGVTPGYLEAIDFEVFSFEYVQNRHGGGKYRACVLDNLKRKLVEKNFQLSGRAKPYEPDNEDQGDDRERLGNGWGFALNGQQQQQSQPVQENVLDQRLAQLERNLSQRFSGDDEDRHDRRSREEEEKQRRLEERLERDFKMKQMELKAQMEADARRAEAQADSQFKFMQLMLQQQQANQQAMITALTAGKSDEGTSSIVKSMVAAMQGLSAVYSNLLSVKSPRRDEDDDDDKPSVKDRAFELIVEQIPTIVSALAPKAAPPPVVVPPAQPMAFRLPDGRIVAPEITARFVQLWRDRYGKDPDDKTLAAGLTELMNSLQQQSAPAPAVEAKPAVKPFVSRDLLVDMCDSFRSKVKPIDFLERVVRLGKLSLEVKTEIGDIYDKANEDEPLISVLTKVFTTLQKYDVEAPADFLATFRGMGGSDWLEDLLAACHLATLEEIREVASKKAVPESVKEST